MEEDNTIDEFVHRKSFAIRGW